MEDFKKDLFLRLKNNIFTFPLTERPPFPKKNLLIEVTNMCNHKCIFCAHKKMKRKQGSIDFDFCSRILQEAYDNGCREVGFYATGEPLLYKRLPEIVFKAKSIGYNYTYITTNGCLLSDSKIKEIVEAGIDSVKLSINAVNRRKYNFIHGKDDFEVVIGNLKRLYLFRMRTKLNFKIFISYIATRYTEDDMDEFYNKFKQYCDEIVFLPVINQTGMNSEIEELSCVKQHNLFVPKPISHIPCSRVFTGLLVTYEGYLSACCADFENQLIIADLNKISLKDAWCSNKAIELRKKHMQRDVRGLICDNCCNYEKKIFSPLSPEFATSIDFQMVYDNNEIKNRVNKLLSDK